MGDSASSHIYRERGDYIVAEVVRDLVDISDVLVHVPVGDGWCGRLSEELEMSNRLEIIREVEA